MRRGDRTVSAHQHHRMRAHRGRQRMAQGGVADQHVGGGAGGVADLEHRDAGAEEAGDVVHRPQLHLVSANGITAGEWLCTTAITSGRAL